MSNFAESFVHGSSPDGSSGTRGAERANCLRVPSDDRSPWFGTIGTTRRIGASDKVQVLMSPEFWLKFSEARGTVLLACEHFDSYLWRLLRMCTGFSCSRLISPFR